MKLTDFQKFHNLRRDMQESRRNKCQKVGGPNKKEGIGSLCPVGASFVLKIFKKSDWIRLLLDLAFCQPPFLTKISKSPPFQYFLNSSSTLKQGMSSGGQSGFLLYFFWNFFKLDVNIKICVQISGIQQFDKSIKNVTTKKLGKISCFYLFFEVS